jgi:acylphosphatase
MEEKKARLTLKIFGRVQRVGFRLGVLRRAEGLSLVGWVRNASDGTVEVVAEGDRGDLEKLRRWCQKGPLFARVDNVTPDWKSYKGEFREFAVVR